MATGSSHARVFALGVVFFLSSGIFFVNGSQVLLQKNLNIDFKISGDTISKAEVSRPPKVIFNANVIKIDQPKHQMIVDWNLSPPEGGCRSGARVFAGDVLLDVSTLDSKSREKYTNTSDSSKEEYFPYFQYNSKRACARSEHAVDFTTVLNIQPLLTMTSKNDPETLGVKLEVQMNYNYITSDAHFRVKDKVTSDFVPLGYHKQDGPPAGSLYRMNYIEFHNSPEGLKFKFHMSKTWRYFFYQCVMFAFHYFKDHVPPTVIYASVFVLLLTSPFVFVHKCIGVR